MRLIAKMLVAVLLFASSAQGQESTAVTRGINAMPGWANGVTLPFDENSMLICDKTTDDNFICTTVGGPVREHRDGNGDEIVPSSNFYRTLWGYTVDASEDSSGVLRVEFFDPVADYTPDQMFDDLNALTTTHPISTYQFWVYDYNYLNSGAVVVPRVGHDVSATSSVGNIANAQFPAPVDCPQVQSVAYCVYDTAGAPEPDGVLDTNNRPFLRLFVDGVDGGNTICQYKHDDEQCGICTGGDIGTVSFDQGELIALKQDCTTCDTNQAQDYWVEITCY